MRACRSQEAGKDYKACCPFHEEKTPSFTVSQDKQFYHCFGCGVNGSAIKFLMDYEHMSFPEAVKDLAQRAGITVPQDTHYSDDKPDITAPLLDVLGSGRSLLPAHVARTSTGARSDRLFEASRAQRRDCR